MQSLRDQNVPKDIVLEILIAMDGIQQVSDSMKVYLERLFVGDEEEQQQEEGASHSISSLLSREQANVSIVWEKRSNAKGHISGTSLLLKLTNKRKVNSQMWWLGCHAKDACATFAFATDCGTILHPDCLAKLIQRLDQDPDLHAVTGFQTGQTCKQQQEREGEWKVDPWGFVLRQVQRHELEVRFVQTKDFSRVCFFCFVSFFPFFP